MISKFILLIVLGSGSSITSQQIEFKTKRNCEEAINEIRHKTIEVDTAGKPDWYVGNCVEVK